VGKLVLAGAVAVAAVYAYQHREWARYWKLYQRSVMTHGWVTGKRPERDGRVDYAFDAGPKIHTDSDTGGFGNPRSEDLDEGDSVIVYYDPLNPRLSCLGGPSDRLRDHNAALMRVLLPAFLVAGLALRRELRRHDSSKAP
jgi:hypothetical protein